MSGQGFEIFLGLYSLTYLFFFISIFLLLHLFFHNRIHVHSSLTSSFSLNVCPDPFHPLLLSTSPFSHLCLSVLFRNLPSFTIYTNMGLEQNLGAWWAHQSVCNWKFFVLLPENLSKAYNNSMPGVIYHLLRLRLLLAGMFLCSCTPGNHSLCEMIVCATPLAFNRFFSPLFWDFLWALRGKL